MSIAHNGGEGQSAASSGEPPSNFTPLSSSLSLSLPAPLAPSGADAQDLAYLQSLPSVPLIDAPRMSSVRDVGESGGAGSTDAATGGSPRADDDSAAASAAPLCAAAAAATSSLVSVHSAQPPDDAGRDYTAAASKNNVADAESSPPPQQQQQHHDDAAAGASLNNAEREEGQTAEDTRGGDSAIAVPATSHDQLEQLTSLGFRITTTIAPPSVHKRIKSGTTFNVYSHSDYVFTHHGFDGWEVGVAVSGTFARKTSVLMIGDTFSLRDNSATNLQFLLYARQIGATPERSVLICWDKTKCALLLIAQPFDDTLLPVVDKPRLSSSRFYLLHPEHDLCVPAPASLPMMPNDKRIGEALFSSCASGATPTTIATATASASNGPRASRRGRAAAASASSVSTVAAAAPKRTTRTATRAAAPTKRSSIVIDEDDDASESSDDHGEHENNNKDDDDDDDDDHDDDLRVELRTRSSSSRSRRTRARTQAPARIGHASEPTDAVVSAHSALSSLPSAPYHASPQQRQQQLTLLPPPPPPQMHQPQQHSLAPYYYEQHPPPQHHGHYVQQLQTTMHPAPVVVMAHPLSAQQSLAPPAVAAAGMVDRALALQLLHEAHAETERLRNQTARTYTLLYAPPPY